MSWRNFKTSPEGQKPQKPQKHNDAPPSVAFVPFVPRSCTLKTPLPHGFTLADLEAAFGEDPLWAKAKDDPHGLTCFAESLH